MVAAHFLTREEKLTGLKLVGNASPASRASPRSSARTCSTGAGADLSAEIAVLAAALSYALGAIFARRMPKLGLKPIDVAAGQATAAALLLAPLALALDRPWTLPPPGAAAIAAVLAIASLSTALAYIVYFRILAGAGRDQRASRDPARSRDVGLRSGRWCSASGWPARQFLGYALIALGLAFIDGRAPRALARRLGVLAPSKKIRRA